MIVDLHARHGAADEPEAINARRLLLNCLHENGKDWTSLTLSIGWDLACAGMSLPEIERTST
jgi:hypothetical protein